MPRKTRSAQRNQSTRSKRSVRATRRRRFKSNSKSTRRSTCRLLHMRRRRRGGGEDKVRKAIHDDDELHTIVKQLKRASPTGMNVLHILTQPNPVEILRRIIKTTVGRFLWQKITVLFEDEDISKMNTATFLQVILDTPNRRLEGDGARVPTNDSMTQLFNELDKETQETIRVIGNEQSKDTVEISLINRNEIQSLGSHLGLTDSPPIFSDNITDKDINEFMKQLLLPKNSTGTRSSTSKSRGGVTIWGLKAKLNEIFEQRRHRSWKGTNPVFVTAAVLVSLSCIACPFIPGFIALIATGGWTGIAAMGLITLGVGIFNLPSVQNEIATLAKQRGWFIDLIYDREWMDWGTRF